ncbi:MAG TPA: flagellar biosynthesis protein FliQ [Gammaproteobacteria bacterium]|nr:flagellar biosynthesis protein FliQ [Gammaproteobacteria bacterium]
MTPDTVLEIGQQALKVTALLAGPMLISVLIVGLLVGMFQTVTSIQEMTLSFIPKLIILALVLGMLGPWMLNIITDFTLELFESIPDLIG